MTVSRLLLAASLLLAALPPAPAQGPARGDDQGPYLGLLFGPAAEGVQVLYVLPDSPAKADVHVNDVLLAYDGQQLRGCEHLVQLLQQDRPKRKVGLLVRRDGKDSRVEVTLASGPVIRLAQAKSDGGTANDAGTARPAQPTVRLSAVPLGDGQLRVTIEYTPDGATAPVKVTCCGPPSRIESEVRTEAGKMPERDRSVVLAALRRLLPADAPKNTSRR
jgi:hypothetical protein